MNQEELPAINKDLILREELAIDRTDMAIDRTLLSFVRTSLYFATAGWSIANLVDVKYGWWTGMLFGLLACLLAIFGVYKYLRQKRRLKESKNRVGGRLAQWQQTKG
jgi:putative membrane protein